MAERILPSDLISTVREVKVIQQQVGVFLETLTRLTVRVEQLEAALKSATRPA
jgi:hypothetical protein